MSLNTGETTDRKCLCARFLDLRKLEILHDMKLLYDDRLKFLTPLFARVRGAVRARSASFVLRRLTSTTSVDDCAQRIANRRSGFVAFCGDLVFFVFCFLWFVFLCFLCFVCVLSVSIVRQHRTV